RLFGVKFLDVAQDENLSVRIGQSVDAGPYEGASLGPGEPRQRLVLPGPDRGTVVPALVEGREQVVDPDLPAPRPGPQSHTAAVDHNAVQPGSQGRVPLEALQGTERREEGVLHGVGAVLLGPEESTGHDEHAPAVLTDQRLAGTLVSSPDALEQFDVVRGTRVPGFGAGGLPRTARRVLGGVRHRPSPCKSSATSPEHAASVAPRPSRSRSRARPGSSTKVTAERSRCRQSGEHGSSLHDRANSATQGPRSLPSSLRVEIESWPWAWVILSMADLSFGYPPQKRAACRSQGLRPIGTQAKNCSALVTGLDLTKGGANLERTGARPRNVVVGYEGSWGGRRKPSFFIRLRSVFGCRPRILAAPRGPSTTHPVWPRTLWMCSLSVASRVVGCSGI